jgi:uroporphyrinogen-III synthase
VYQWELPEDVEPLREAVRRLSRDEVDVTLLTTATQVVHLMQVAEQMHLRPAVEAGLRASRIVSIGPTTTETVLEYGFEVGLEPTHPKLGLLVKEAAEWVGAVDGG